MWVHSREKIQKIKDLRADGRSIMDIMAILSLPKSTVWHHVQKINLSDKQKQVLRAKQGGSKIRMQKEIRLAEEYADLLLKGKNREGMVIMSMLYWAEGHKKGRCQFTNTDARMIALYLKIVRNCLKIPEDRIHITVRVFTGMDKDICVKHWQKVTGVNSKKFKVRVNDGGTSGRTEYGMCMVTIRRSQSTLKLMGILVDKIVKSY